MIVYFMFVLLTTKILVTIYKGSNKITGLRIDKFWAAIISTCLYYQEIDWVEPSFIDFCETAKLSSSVLHKKSLTNTDNFHKSKEHFPLLENYKCGRKIRKPFSVDEKYKHFKQNHSQIEPWVDKYKPKTQVQFYTI